MKFITQTLTIIFFLLGCSGRPSGESAKATTRVVDDSINIYPFYLPKPYDDWWRLNEPNLNGATGWISCAGTDSTRVEIVSSKLSHKGWGSYKGELVVSLLESIGRDTVNLNCFVPDYSVGVWLGRDN